jgi:hypothetical protein
MTDASSSAPLTGGCLCGAVRYRIEGRPKGSVAHCHCTMCRRANGAVAVTWTTLNPDQFEVTRGALARYASSEKGERGFCPTCGSQISFRHADFPDEVDVTVATLDRPEDMPASLHIWTENRLPWLHLDEHLPDREDGSDPLLDG